jgi:ATP-dependent DNA helicase RecQ
VQHDIQKNLGMLNATVFKSSFNRANLYYEVRPKTNNVDKDIIKYIRSQAGKSGIIYCLSRKKVEELSETLHMNGISVLPYHAGMDSHVRSQNQDSFLMEKADVIVATIAFGMGIDKPDVRFVVHLDLPDCLEAYFQEAGRAGRDEKKSFAVLLYSDSDKIDMKHNLQISYPAMDDIRKTYQALANYFQLPIGAGKGSTLDFDIHDFCSRYNLNPLISFNAIKLLEREGYFVMTDSFYQPSRVHFLLNKEQLYKFQVENVHFDEFIKIVLRSYSGVFDNYVKVSEPEIGKRIGKTADEVKNIFIELEKREILTYLPQTEMPRITFLAERTDSKNILISPENLRKRKEKSEERMGSMVHYATTKTKCRSQLLLSYFGETDSYRCGICDICLERNKLELSSLEFESVSEQIKKNLSTHPLTLIEIVDTVNNSSIDKTIKVVQWLIDNGKLTYIESNKLAWHK